MRNEDCKTEIYVLAFIEVCGLCHAILYHSLSDGTTYLPGKTRLHFRQCRTCQYHRRIREKNFFFFLCSNSCSSSGGSYVIKECLLIMIPPPQQGGDYCFSEGQAIPLFFAQTMVPSQKCLMLLLLSAMQASVNKDSCHKLGAEV